MLGGRHVAPAVSAHQSSFGCPKDTGEYHDVGERDSQGLCLGLTVFKWCCDVPEPRSDIDITWCNRG